MQKQEIKELSEKVFSGVASDEEILMYNRLCNDYNITEGTWDDNLYGNRNELEEELKQKIRKRLI
jgi:transmembrane sensor